MNSFKTWVIESRKQQSRAPERYLVSYPELIMDDTCVMMTPETLARIERDCGRYDGSVPTGVYLGKMFLQGEYLFWFGICKEKPMTDCTLKARKIVLVSS